MGTCNWPVDTSCLPDTGDDPVNVNKLAAAVSLAQEVLWALSGRQYGACSVIARPCKGGGGCPTPGEIVSWGSNQVPWFPMWTGGRWQNVTCCGQNQCGANGPNVVHLPGPVNKVLEVTINGVALPSTSYVLEGDYLYRTDAAWPGQNLGAPLGSDGTWGVTYLRGHDVPEGVGAFVSELATEFYKMCTGNKTCRLPRRVKSMNRQGVSYEMSDPTDIYASGKTGLPTIDLWLSSVNPHHLMSAPRVR